MSILIIAYLGFWMYSGRFIVVLLNLLPEEELFHVDVEIPPQYKEVLPGEEILVQLTLHNLERIGIVDVNVEYGIEDIVGNEIISEHTTLAIEGEVSTIRDLDVPFNIKPGNYMLFARARYDDVAGTGSSLFRVIAKGELGMDRITVFSLIIIVFVFLIIIIILSLCKRVTKI